MDRSACCQKAACRGPWTLLLFLHCLATLCVHIDRAALPVLVDNLYFIGHTPVFLAELCFDGFTGYRRQRGLHGLVHGNACRISQLLITLKQRKRRDGPERGCQDRCRHYVSHAIPPWIYDD